MNRSFKRMGGFSLVEMMVALVAGMIVLGAVLAFTVSSVRAIRCRAPKVRRSASLSVSVTGTAAASV